MKTERSYGIDLLRILSTMMVLVLHVFSNGGVLNQLVPGTSNYYVGWLLEAMCFCAVDVFAIITGYLMVDRKVEYWKFIPRWFQAWTISVVVTVLYKMFAEGGRVSAKEWLTCLFPVTYSQWKYLTEYFIVVLFMPYINLAIRGMSVHHYRVVLIMIFGFSVWTTVSFSDPMNLLGGYSAVWIGLLYIVGALIKKTELDKRVSKVFAVGGFFTCALLAYGSKVCEVFLNGRMTRLTQGTGFLMNYVSPAILLCAVFLLIFFSQVKTVSIRLIPVIRWMSSVSFGVFLIHTQTIIRTRFYIPVFSGIAGYATAVFLMIVISSTLGIYLLCGMLEYVRQYLSHCIGVDQKSRCLYEKAKDGMQRWIDIWL